MRIGRFEAEDETRIGVFTDDHVRDVTSDFEDFQDTLSRPHDANEVDGGTFVRDEITFKPPTTDWDTVFCEMPPSSP